MLHRSRDSGREFAGWNQLPCGPVLTPNISCTKLKIHSAHADSPIILFRNRTFILCRQFGFRTSLCLTLRSRNSGREFAGWNQLPCGPVLTPNISCTKPTIHSAHADSPIILFRNRIFILCRQFGFRTSLCLTLRSKNSGREFAGWNQLPRGPVLTPKISCTKLKIYSVHADSLTAPNYVLNLVPAI